MMRAVMFVLAVCLATQVQATTLSDLVAEKIPSVCIVKNSQMKTTVVDSNKNYMDEYLKKPQSHSDEQSAIGTCFIVEYRGINYMITNHHVISSPGDLHVQLYKDLKQYPAYIVGSDEDTDIAVIALTDDKLLQTLKPLVWGESELLRKGDPVWAIGHPLWQTYSVSSGIVSNEARRSYNIWQELIQIDAAINQGNSGGPLFNYKGEVVGVNTLIISKSGGQIGINFSVSSRVAQHVANSLIDHGSVPRAIMGFQYSENHDTGTIDVMEVLDGSGASESGLMIGDSIMSINGTPIVDVQSVGKSMDFVEPGDAVQISVKRKGEALTLRIVTSPLNSER